MDMASLVTNSSEKGNVSSPSPKSGCRPFELNSEGIENEITVANFVGSENIAAPTEHDASALSKLDKVDENSAAKRVSKSTPKKKKVASKLKSRRYPLRSSLGGGRVLRSRSKTKSKTEPEPANTPVNPVNKKRKKGKKLNRASIDDFSLIRKRVRYLLTRMNYEQSLIDAYSGEGWKGQSAEKIKPEKELERAKSEILRCKLKIRELFRHLDSLSVEGRFEDSLFDSDGQIDSEDIFCAKCGTKDVSTDNDIILCDGICERGFHQKCLNPPLLSEDIPVGDEGWLCPACDCKVDSIELVNEFQGSNLSIKDKWQKVFPEAAVITNGEIQHDGLSSDDSEDNDYDPESPEADETDEDKSDSSSESVDSDASNKNEKDENLGLPSDDSEDDDFDPDAPDFDKSIQKDESSSGESDFTSDSDEFCNELRKSSGANEDSVSSLPILKSLAQSDDGKGADDVKNSELLPMAEGDVNQENVLVSKKRQLERLDYKKLYDEAYAKSSSDSSDDEDWSESTGNKGKKYVKRKESNGMLKANGRTTENQRNSKSLVAMLTDVDAIRKSDIDDAHDSQEVHGTTPAGTHRVLDPSSAEHQLATGHNCSQDPHSSANKSCGSAYRRLGEITTQKLNESFQENQYPTREMKERLAHEVGLTYRQVDKWFINARHSFRASSKGVTSPSKESVSATATRVTETPNSNISQSSPNNGNKKKKSASAKKVKVGAEAGEGGDSAEAVDATAARVTETPNGNISQSSPNNVNKRKKSVLAKKAKVDAEAGEGGDDAEAVDTTEDTTATRVTETPNNNISQSSPDNGNKRKKSASAKKAKVGAEAGEGGDSAEAVDATTTRVTETPSKNISESSPNNGSKRKKSAPAKKAKVGAEAGEGGDSAKAVDGERQKAIARELRKIKQRR